MKSQNDGGPAFPALHSLTSSAAPDYRANTSGGMSLRDYFAAHAPITLAEIPNETRGLNGLNKPEKLGWRIGQLAHFRYIYADAMLAARSRNTEGQQATAL